MNQKMTAITQDLYRRAVSHEMTVNEAAAMLDACAEFRKLSDKLKAAHPGEDLRAALVAGLCKHHPEASAASIDRKVRNWLADRQSAIAKQDAIELCFVFGLSVDEADGFLAMIAEEGFHWRDPDEMVYIYALGHGMDYAQARTLHGEIMAQIALDKDEQDPVEDAFTAVIREEVLRIDSPDALREYMERAQSRLGKKHNTAYRLFLAMLSQLEATEIDDGLDAESRYGAIDIARCYLFQRPIPKGDGKRDEPALSAMQRNVKANWPDEYGLSRMKNRATDVTRKVMILLFLATYELADEDEDEEPLTQDEQFQDFYQKMDDMLEYCGFSRLDPRVPFDWMTLYCMCAEDLFFLDQRMEAFLGALFHTGNALQDD